MRIMRARELVVVLNFLILVFDNAVGKCPTGVCLACELHGPEAPRLYSIQRHDGIGGSLSHELMFLAFADMQGFNYGGTLGQKHAVSWNHHNEDMDSAAEFFLGSSSRTIHPRNVSLFPFQNHELTNKTGLVASPTRSVRSAAILAPSAMLGGVENEEEGWQSVGKATQIRAFQVSRGNTTTDESGAAVADTLFAGRRVVVVPDGNYAFQRVRVGTLMTLQRPWVFDDLVVGAWNLLAKLPKNQPEGRVVFRPQLLNALRKGAACQVAAAAEPDYFKPHSQTVVSGSLVVAQTSGRSSNRRSANTLSVTNASFDSPNMLSPNTLYAALHVRRGDVDARNSHYSSDGYFFQVVDLLQALLSGVDQKVKVEAHVFSSTEKKCSKVVNATMEACEEEGEKLYDQATAFQGFEKRYGKSNVHLDGSTHNHWSHFARADIFIVSKSAFSNAPAFLNKRCVIWQPSVWTPLRLPHWVTLEELAKRSTGKRLLDACLLGSTAVHAQNPGHDAAHDGERGVRGGVKKRKKTLPYY
mmetsp:Transcript_6354/g.13119  ORF Transcript_6354/g.13119 Transcript_6354/m.13119 type:complete len:527 (-) Transcript_6354:53-1633(-)